MSQFFHDLWDSIFTPGTTPTLVRATHYSFAALLVTLASLTIATFNKHFLILTFIAGCLWGTLTWFISELEKVKEQLAKQNAPVEGSEEEAKDDDEDDKNVDKEKLVEEKTEIEKKDE
ncbi:ER protein Pkr1-domain-containing protein [Lipomyces japonicus]|uniref:ER protein Pkr1-domain-containing protein n=1 Tax=Lipomyces japonicus TaxID=56871 RepID=UPI0034CD3A77